MKRAREMLYRSTITLTKPKTIQKSQPKSPQQNRTVIQTLNKVFFPTQAVKVNGTFDTGSIFSFWKQPGSPSCQCILFLQKTTN